MFHGVDFDAKKKQDVRKSIQEIKQKATTTKKTLQIIFQAFSVCKVKAESILLEEQ